MLREKVHHHYIDEDRNCAEAVLMAINEEYKLGLTVAEITLVSGFGGGMGCGSTCGALSGCIASLGKMEVLDKAHTTPGFRKKCGALVAAFEQKLGSTECKVLKGKYKNPECRCLETVQLAADVFEEFVK